MGCGGSFPVLNNVARGGLAEKKQHLSEDLKEGEGGTRIS